MGLKVEVHSDKLATARRLLDPLAKEPPEVTDAQRADFKILDFKKDKLTVPFQDAIGLNGLGRAWIYY